MWRNESVANVVLKFIYVCDLLRRKRFVCFPNKYLNEGNFFLEKQFSDIFFNPCPAFLSRFSASIREHKNVFYLIAYSAFYSHCPDRRPVAFYIFGSVFVCFFFHQHQHHRIRGLILLGIFFLGNVKEGFGIVARKTKGKVAGMRKLNMDRDELYFSRFRETRLKYFFKSFSIIYSQSKEYEANWIGDSSGRTADCYRTGWKTEERETILLCNRAFLIVIVFVSSAWRWFREIGRWLVVRECA